MGTQGGMRWWMREEVRTSASWTCRARTTKPCYLDGSSPNIAGKQVMVTARRIANGKYHFRRLTKIEHSAILGADCTPGRVRQMLANSLPVPLVFAALVSMAAIRPDRRG